MRHISRDRKRAIFNLRRARDEINRAERIRKALKRREIYLAGKFLWHVVKLEAECLTTGLSFARWFTNKSKEVSSRTNGDKSIGGNFSQFWCNFEGWATCRKIFKKIRKGQRTWSKIFCRKNLLVKTYQVFLCFLRGKQLVWKYFSPFLRICSEFCKLKFFLQF